MKRLKTYLLSIFTVAAFSMFMMFSVTTTDEGFDFSMCGETVMASGNECDEVDGGTTPRILNYTGEPGHELNCNHAGNGCVPCTVSPDPEEN